MPAARLSCLAISCGAFGMTLPDPEHIVAILAAIGLGAGFGLGSGYAAFLSRSSAAKVQAFKLWDEVHRSSNQFKLEQAVRQHEQAMAEIQKNATLLQQLRGELEEERAKAERLESDLVSFAMRVLTDKGYLEPKKEAPHVP